MVLYTALPQLSHCPTEAWQPLALHVLNRGRILLNFLSPSRTNDLLVLSLWLCSPAPIVSWKNTLFLGVDACFKLKLKDRGIKDPDLGTGLSHVVKEGPFQKYLAENADTDEPVSSFFHSNSLLTP